MNIQYTTAALAALAFSTGALAGLPVYTNSFSLIQDDTHNANFNALVQQQSLVDYQEDGLNVNVDRDYFSWDAPGFDGSEMYYASTGSLSRYEITLADGGNLNDFEMQVSSGWQSESSTVYLWIEVFQNDDSVGSFDVDTTYGQYVGIQGINFDTVRIGAYATAELRDAHNESERNALALDNLSVGTYVPVPTPGTLAISATALFGLRRRRA